MWSVDAGFGKHTHSGQQYKGLACSESVNIGGHAHRGPVSVGSTHMIGNLYCWPKRVHYYGNDAKNLARRNVSVMEYHFSVSEYIFMLMSHAVMRGCIQNIPACCRHLYSSFGSAKHR
jgi:hypothetical protein